MIESKFIAVPLRPTKEQLNAMLRAMPGGSEVIGEAEQEVGPVILRCWLAAIYQAAVLAAPNHEPRLTKRQWDVYELLHSGMNFTQIAEEMGVTKQRIAAVADALEAKGAIVRHNGKICMVPVSPSEART